MKKTIITVIFGLLIIIVTGCSGNPGASEVKAQVRDAITRFYEERRSSPVEYSIEIFKIKSLEEDFLAVAVLRGEEGQPSLDLLLIQKQRGKYSVSKTGFGSIAISMGFSVNRVTYNNKTLIFGSLKDSTWVPKTDKRKKVSYAKVKAVFNNGKSIEENIKGDKAYLLIVDEVSGLQDLSFYNEKGQVEGSFNDLGIQIEEVDFPSAKITIQDIIEKHIPKPFNHGVSQNNLEFQGKWKGEVMPGLISKMNEIGWEELQNERLGAMQFFSKEINGQKVRISVLPIEKGGSNYKNKVSTFVYFDLIK